MFTKYHGRQSYLKLQNWLIWTKVANTWVGMDRIPCNEYKKMSEPMGFKNQVLNQHIINN
jgi:hypothetical protein